MAVEQQFAVRLREVEAIFHGAFFHVTVDGLLGDLQDLGGLSNGDEVFIVGQHCVLDRFCNRLGDGGFQYFVEEGLKHIIG